MKNSFYLHLFIINLASCLFVNKLYAQHENSYKIYGTVLDSLTNEPLEFVTIYIPETSFYTETDGKGSYVLNIQNKNYFSLKCSRLGFQSKSIEILFSPGQSTKNIIFKLSSLTQSEIVIKENQNKSGIEIKEQLKSFEFLPTVSSNIENILPSIALGVRASSGGELSSQYSVRGGSYDENLVFINDFEIFRPQLIRNGQQEGLSIINPDLIRDLQFSSGGFESKYGDKLSSVLALKYKLPDTFKASAAISPLGMSSHLEGRKKILNRNFRYLLGARYKTTKYILGSLDVKGEYQPSFFDLQSYLSYDLNTAWQLSLLSNWNKSKYTLVPESSVQGKGSVFLVLRLNTYFEGAETDLFDQQMAGISLTYLPKKVKTPHFLKFNSSIHRGYEAEQYDILAYYRLVEIETGLNDQEDKEIKLWGEGIQHTYARNYLQNLVYNHEIRGGCDLNSSSDRHHVLQYGFSLRQEFFNDKLNEWERIDSAGYSLPYHENYLNVNYVLKTRNKFHNEKITAWVLDEFKVNSNRNSDVILLPGFRVNQIALSNEWLLSPRFKIAYYPNKQLNKYQFWFSTGLYAQPAFYREMQSPEGIVNTNILAQKSWHYVLGMKKYFDWKKVSESKFQWISEVYYKTLWDLVSYDLENVRIKYAGTNDSKAYAIGWDNRINGEFVPGSESWLNLSFLRTRESLNGVQHLKHVLNSTTPVPVEDVPRPTDQFFALGLFFQDYLPRNENFKMHLNITVASGLPYGFKGDNIVYRNEYRHKAYHRVDLGFSSLLWDEKWKKKNNFNPFKFSKTAWLSLEIFNLLKIKNEAGTSWIKSIYNYEFSIPNYLSSRRINLKLKLDF